MDIPIPSCGLSALKATIGFMGFAVTPASQFSTSQAMSGLRHFQNLIASQDRLYVGADGRVYAFVF